MRKLSILAIVLVLSFTLTQCTTEKKKPSDGWTSLFDGKTLNGWKPVAGEAEYTVQDSAIVGIAKANTPNTFLISEQEYGDFILELDIKVEHKTSNSGVQIRSNYDPNGRDGNGLVHGYQVELDPTDRAWAGGIYDEARRGWLYPLSLNPKASKAFKFDEYNSYRIEAIGNEIKTWVNGVETAYLIDSTDAKGIIGLQVHSINNPEDEGNKTYFKNIRIKTDSLKPTPFKNEVYVVNNLKNQLSDYEKKTGWKLLFNGKDSEGWVGAYKDSFPDFGWTINDGILTIEASGGEESTHAGDIVTTEKYSAFDLSFDFKLSEGANSGVKYFVTLSEGNEGSAIGLEYQILDDEKHPDAKKGKNGNRTLASLYDLIPAKKQSRFIKPIGEWNRGRVVVHPNNKVEYYLNGVKVLEFERGSEAYRELVAESKYKIWENFGVAEEGHILLQDHGDKVSFKNIKIKELK
ncbi:DUF1080 domain-containing protein [Galbibacter sp. EGI 63066]|uniref:3-keto-disaccharide hydrolase n=1 Tax=Galbibacter sp. EGI 63066 TaxID=2993559 RepID=UPI0022493914|nr:DUF1080 domain-containing protein [Galbibacter sp. EGI 63066]MCX2678993.1 DUF1080 domain-containing protein [Galbibacter sp. EGI 63066]